VEGSATLVAVWMDYSKYDVPYSIGKAGSDRFAIAPKGNTLRLLGYVFSNGNGTWSAERTGKKLRQVYASIDEAAKALLAFASMARTTH
jgi:hypothetical protein